MPSFHDQFSPLLYLSIDYLMDASLPIGPRQGASSATDLGFLVYREAADGTSLGYLPTADEVAGSVMFFASPLSAPVTGHRSPVTGHRSPVRS
jgi:hypothetical protein